MNHWTRLPLLSVVCALVVLAFAGTASAVTLSPTNAPLPGSTFQGGDGNQTNPSGDVSSPADGIADADWQSFPNAPGGKDDPIGGDKAFAGGDKETEPGVWGLQNEGVGVNPSKDNILGAWSTSAASVNGTPSTFLNLAF